jgi:ribonucleoside-diphosphate reductase alpha chain
MISSNWPSSGNLGSINLGSISSLEELRDVVKLASKFLVCGSVRADLPYEKVKRVREQYRKIGLGLMGVHEWLLQRNYGYEVNDELRRWLEVYREVSEASAKEHASRLFISAPVRFRAIAPSGTIGILASTTTGLEPLFAVAYKRRYLTGTRWKYRYEIDNTAQRILDVTGCDYGNIQTAYKLSSTLQGIEDRVRFQYEIQKYVDMGISSTINLATWGTSENNEDVSRNLARLLARYAPGLRGITCYPNGSRGGQPLTEVDYMEAKRHHAQVFEEEDTKGCVGGICGL